MKVAYYCEPQVGGTFTFFQRLREGMQRQGIEVRCVSPVSGEKFAGTRFDGLDGVDYVRFPDDPAAATRILAGHAADGRFDLAMILPGCDLLTTNLVRYLPRRIRTFARIPMMTEGAYRPVRAVADHLDRVVCVCERIRDDLAASVPGEKLTVIHNGCDTSLFAPPPAREDGPLKAVYAGRLEDVQKNVLMLPRILARVRAALPDATLTIVGHGPDGARLRALTARLGLAESIYFADAVPNAQLPGFYGRADVLVFPTRFEGSPNALMEAMACGCVPVVSYLRGSTSSIVEDGRNGFLCRVDDLDEFSRRVVELGRDRGLLRRMQAAAGACVRANFTMERMTDAYARAFRETLASPDRRPAPLELSRYEVPRSLRPTWRRLVPRSVKTFLRTRLERLGRST